MPIVRRRDIGTSGLSIHYSYAKQNHAGCGRSNKKGLAGQPACPIEDAPTNPFRTRSHRQQAALNFVQTAVVYRVL